MRLNISLKTSIDSSLLITQDTVHLHSHEEYAFEGEGAFLLQVTNNPTQVIEKPVSRKATFRSNWRQRTWFLTVTLSSVFHCIGV